MGAPAWEWPTPLLRTLTSPELPGVRLPCPQASLVLPSGLSVEQRASKVQGVLEETLLGPARWVALGRGLPAPMRVPQQLHACIAVHGQATSLLLLPTGLPCPPAFPACSDTQICALSGGQTRRWALACCLLRDPKAILLDEPTSGLDATMALSVMRVLHSQAKAGRMVVSERWGACSRGVVAAAETAAETVASCTRGYRDRLVTLPPNSPTRPHKKGAKHSSATRRHLRPL